VPRPHNGPMRVCRERTGIGRCVLVYVLVMRRDMKEVSSLSGIFSVPLLDAAYHLA